MSTASADGERRYVAFISYSHVDRDVARWLHRAIESYRPPAHMRETPGADGARIQRLAPVFLDREELSSSSDLAGSVRSALQNSGHLIIVCSPHAARSRWVNEEARSFKALGRGDRILCLIVAGEPGAAERGLSPDLECLPPAMRFEVVDGRITDRPAPEPLAADIRAGGDDRRDARLKIIAGLLGTRLDELRQRDQVRRQKRLAIVGVAATIGCVVFAGLAAAAWLARNEAERQRRIAVQKSLTAERTADFLVSLFKVSDPSEARGNTITAREVLDRGARQIDDSLRNEPQVRADLSTTLGEVYTGLGLYGPALDLLSRARSVQGQDPASQIRQTISLAELEFQRGNDARADELLAAADRLYAEQGELSEPAMRARLLLDRGDVAAVRGADTDAQKYFDQALAIAEQFRLSEVRASALEGLGLTHFYAGDMPTADRWLSQALEARIAASGETHPKVSETLTVLGSSAYMRGDNSSAERYWLRSLEIDRRVLGPRHPDLGATMVNVGRLRLEARDFDHAVEILEEAVSIMAAQQSENHDSLVFGQTNLALAHMGLREYTTAESLLHRALRAAVATGHRLEGPILTDLADLECRTGRADEGLARLVEARPIVAARYPDDPWRVAHVDNIRADCLARLGQTAEAERLVFESAPIVLAKWPATTMYGYDTLERAKRVYESTGNRARLAELRQLANRP